MFGKGSTINPFSAEPFVVKNRHTLKWSIFHMFAKLMLENVSETFGVTRGGFQEIIHPHLNFERWTRVMEKTKIIPMGIVLLILKIHTL